MARMYPDHPLGDTKSNAERKVFYALKDTLSNDYMVLHSVPIYRRPKKNGPLLDGEIDFLILHSDKGMIAIEVKGGALNSMEIRVSGFQLPLKVQSSRLKTLMSKARHIAMIF